MKKNEKMKVWEHVAKEVGPIKLFYQFNGLVVEKTIMVDGKPIDVLKNDEYLHTQGTAFAATTKFLGFGEDDKYVIIIDEFFNQLPEYVQDFILQHEIGHIVNGDIGSKSAVEIADMNQQRRLGNLNQMELKADEYAAKELGYAMVIGALYWLRDETDCNFVMIKEFNTRIKYLEKMEKIEDMPEEKKQKRIKSHERNRKIAAAIASPYFILTFTIAVLVAILVAAFSGKLTFKTLKTIGEKTKATAKRIISKYYQR